MANPINIFSQLKQVADTYQSLKQRMEANQLTDADKATVKQLIEQMNEVRDALKDAGNKLEFARDHWLPPSGRDQAIREVSNLINFKSEGGGETGGSPGGGETPTTAGAGKSSNIALREFLENISTSLIDSQIALNKSSLEYVSALDPRFPPAYYGIPGIKAEMRVGFQEIKEKGVNMILFTDLTQKQNYAESTVTFEIVGSPPPPGPTVFGNYVVPVPRFLTVGEKRRSVLEEVGKILNGAKFDHGREVATVLRYEEEPDGLTGYLVLWPGFQSNEQLPQWRDMAMVYVTEDKDGKFTIPTTKDDSIFEVPAANGVFHLDKSTQDSLVQPIISLLPASVPAATKDQIKANANALAAKVVNFGDVMANVQLIFHLWIEAVRYKPKQL
jgi:hypothetical protein